MNWDYILVSEQTRHHQRDTRIHTKRRKDLGRVSVHTERNFPHGQGWLSSVTINASHVQHVTPLVRLSLGGYRCGHPFGVQRFRGVIHLSVLDLTLTVIWR